MKILCCLLGFALWANNVQAQTVNGCLIGNSVYTSFAGYSNLPIFAGARFYGNTIATFSSCGFTFAGSGYSCYVYKGTGDPSDEVNYAGPYAGGNFTLVANCPVDSCVWFLLILSILYAFKHRFYNQKSKQSFTVF